MVLQPYASSMAVLSDDEKKLGVVLVDIGGGTTDITIFQDGIIRPTTSFKYCKDGLLIWERKLVSNIPM